MKITLLLIFLFCSLSNCFSQIYYDNWPVTISTNDRTKLQDSIEFAPSYVLIGTDWGHRIITYFFQNGTGDIDGNDEHEAVREAFAIWAAETDLAFHEVCSANDADILISWETGAHGDPFPPCAGGATDFDGIGGVLAHDLRGK